MVEVEPKKNASILAQDQGERLRSSFQDITMKVSGLSSEFTSTFEVGVPPGFDSGAHYHTRTEEFFYVLKGSLLFMAFVPVSTAGDWFDWIGKNGERPKLCHAGSCVHVPKKVPHAFVNVSSNTARMLFQASPPPDHEEYFKGLIEILNESSTVDSNKISELRRQHDVTQLTELRSIDYQKYPCHED